MFIVNEGYAAIRNRKLKSLQKFPMVYIVGNFAEKQKFFECQWKSIFISALIDVIQLVCAQCSLTVNNPFILFMPIELWLAFSQFRTRQSVFTAHRKLDKFHGCLCPYKQLNSHSLIIILYRKKESSTEGIEHRLGELKMTTCMITKLTQNKRKSMPSLLICHM